MTTKKFLVDVIVTYEITEREPGSLKDAVQDLKDDLRQNLLFDTIGSRFVLKKKKCRISDLGITPLRKKTKKS
jgi:hypothetical protein